MKRRVKTQPTNPYYSNEPAVARSQITSKAPVQNASLGNSTPKMVDKKPGRASGVAGFSDHHRPPAKGMQNPAFVKPLKGGTAKPSSIPKLKVSGHSKAHQIGSVKPLKLKV